MLSQIYSALACAVGAACNLCPEALPPEINWFAQLDGDVADDGVEALGLYHPAKKLIEIDTAKCKSVAGKLGQTIDAVAGVVFLHELSHWVHHTGRCIRNHLWNDFAQASPDTIEELAQENTFFSIVLFHPSFLEAMIKLSSRSPARYRRWEKHLQIVDEVAKLQKARSEFALSLWSASNHGAMYEAVVLEEPIDG